MKKKIGIGSVSFVLAIIAFVWSYEIMGFCFGDSVLATLNIPAWSNSANASGIHYTVFYAFLFLIPSIVLSVKYKNDCLAQVGKWLSIILATILIIGLFFMV